MWHVLQAARRWRACRLVCRRWRALSDQHRTSARFLPGTPRGVLLSLLAKMPSLRHLALPGGPEGPGGALLAEICDRYGPQLETLSMTGPGGFETVAAPQGEPATGGIRAALSRCPRLATWALPLARPERGCVLLAQPGAMRDVPGGGGAFLRRAVVLVSAAGLC